jgi:hypothetical protein
MNSLFWIPFTTGVLHTLALKDKKDKQWGTTLSILGTTSMYTTLTSIRNEYFLKPEHQKMIPSKLSAPAFVGTSLFFSRIHSGEFFCLGHLVSKKAYPVFEDEYSSRS